MRGEHNIRKFLFIILNSFSLIINSIMLGLCVLLCVPAQFNPIDGYVTDYAVYGSIGVLFTSGMCMMNILLFKFFRLPDEEIINNKYFIGVVGLLSGQIFIPFMILFVIPNVSSKWTISPKTIVSKAYGTITLWAGLAALSAITFNNLGLKIGFFGANHILVYTFMAIAIYGLLNVLLFWNKGFSELHNKDTKLNFIQLFFAFINCIMATIGLFILMLFSVLAFFESIARLFQGSNQSGILAGLSFFLRLFNVIYAFYRMIMIVKFASESIRIIWSRDVVEMRAYEKVDEFMNSNKQNINA